MRGFNMKRIATLILPFLCLCVGDTLSAQATTPPYAHADTLRGSIGPARAWWDVEQYDLHVRLDPADSTISGYNTITYGVLASGNEMQIDLQQPLEIDSIVQDGHALRYRRDGNAFFASLTTPQRPGTSRIVTVYYHGQPQIAQRPPWDGGLIVARDSVGRPWLATANQGLGASVWWPNKDTQTDEPERQRIAVTVPDPMVEVSNGRLSSITDNDGTRTFEWFVRNPINNYNVTLTAGSYAHFESTYEGEDGTLTLDFWPLDYHLDAAREQFRQVEPMLACFESWFGPYPWYDDGFKLIETPHLGMEHQSAIAYGNGYTNGYRGSDLSGTGLGLEFDFIIIHESAHEWWGNNITSADLADMWIHESFANYAESLYVECQRDTRAGADYVIGVRSRVQNDRPIIPAYGVNAEGSGDMYYKGGNMLHTIRQLVDDDARWRDILRGLNSEFRHQIVTADDIQGYMDEHTDADLDPVFRQYLTTTSIPTLEYEIDGARIRYRWIDAVPGFAMPVEARTGTGGCVVLHPTDEWTTSTMNIDAEAFEIDRDYFVRLKPTDGAARDAAGDCG